MQRYFIVCVSSWVMEGGSIEPFFRRFLYQGLRSTFFQVRLENSIYIKNSEYESQKKKKEKKILIEISTIFHFWSPTLTSSWQSVFVSLFAMVYTPLPRPLPHPQICFCGAKFFFHVLQLGAEKISNFLGAFCIERN